MVIKIAAIVGFIAVIGFGVYFFLLRPAPVEIVQIPAPTPPEERPTPYITPPVGPRSFFEESPLSRNLPPGFDFQTIGAGENSSETMGVVSETELLPGLREGELGPDPLSTIKFMSDQDLKKLSELDLTTFYSPEQELQGFVKNLTDSLATKGLIDSSEKKDFLTAANSVSKLLNQVDIKNIKGINSGLDAALQPFDDYLNALTSQGALSPAEKQSALEAAKSTAALSLGSQSNVLGPLESFYP